ncbi:MAG: hypothetical protein WAM71_19045 [Candidatus Korobacteraceae bacterium]
MQQQPDSPSKTTVPSVTNPSGENTERLRYVEHRGKRILLADMSTCTEEQLAECIRSVPQYVTKLPEHSVLLLGDFTGTHFTKETIEQLKIAAVFDRPHVAKAAWVLSDNLHQVLIESIRNFSAREIPVFATREEALDYLVS